MRFDIILYLNIFLNYLVILFNIILSLD